MPHSWDINTPGQQLEAAILIPPKAAAEQNKHPPENKAATALGVSHTGASSHQMAEQEQNSAADRVSGY